MMKGYPKWFSPLFVCSIVGILSLSGILLMPSILNLRLDWRVPWRLSGDSRILITSMHALFSLLTLVMLGALSSIHVRNGWNKRERRLSGVAVVVSLALLALTGLGIYYLGSDTLSLVNGLSHSVIGVAFISIFGWHISAYAGKFINSKKTNGRSDKR